jgi:uncharacterized membrane protein YwzB
MKKNLQITITSLFISLSCLFVFANVNAQSGLTSGIIKDSKKTELDNNLNKFADQTSVDRTKSLEEMIGTAIQIVLGTLGTIFIVLMFVAGNTWMQAAGNEEKVKKSKARIQSLIVGLVIVLLAYALSSGFSGLLAKALLK